MRHRAYGFVGFVVACILLVTGVSASAQTLNTVLKIAAGPSGSEVNGTFRLDEERARFDPASDKQVVVLFQWEGAAGAHRLGVQWRSPDGGLSTNSALDYVAKDRRFGAYWTLPLNPTLPAGLWSVEATIDGEPAGRFTFELAPMAMRATAAARRPLSASDMFSRLSAAFVVLDRQSMSGQHLDPAAAFNTGQGRLTTAIAALDGADVVDAIYANGARKRVDALVAWNRRQDWAVIADPAAASDLPVAAASTAKVGDRCFSMEGTTTGGRVLVEGSITGDLNTPGTGGRLLAQWNNGTGTPGAPVVNEFGELMGFVGGTMVPGTSGVADLLHFRATLRGTPIVPQTLVRPVPNAAITPIADLRARAELLPALRGSEHVLSAGFAKRLIRSNFVSPSEQQDEFVAEDKSLVAFVSWNAQARLKGMLAMKLFDETDHLIASSKPKKIDLRPNASMLSSWEIPVPTTPGWYRAEFLVDGVPVYRSFMHVGS
jgi:hypothetical protein